MDAARPTRSARFPSKGLRTPVIVGHGIDIVELSMVEQRLEAGEHWIDATFGAPAGALMTGIFEGVESL
jgi:hypothetical protein